MHLTLFEESFRDSCGVGWDESRNMGEEKRRGEGLGRSRDNSSLDLNERRRKYLESK